MRPSTADYSFDPYSAVSTWQDFGITLQDDDFTVTFDATPSALELDGVIAFGDVTPVSEYWDNAIVVRFYTTGVIEAFDDTDYDAVEELIYVAETTYTFTDRR